MTNRDPNNPDFIRKVVDFYDCYKDYISFSNKEKLLEDNKRSDIELVCNYELAEVKRHIRNNGGIFFSDFYKFPTIPKEREFLAKLGKH